MFRNNYLHNGMKHLYNVSFFFNGFNALSTPVRDNRSVDRLIQARLNFSR